MVNRTRINSAQLMFLWKITGRQAISPVAKFHHVLEHGFMIQRVILILSNVSQPIRINYLTWKYNICGCYWSLEMIRKITFLCHSKCGTLKNLKNCSMAMSAKYVKVQNLQPFTNNGEIMGKFEWKILRRSKKHQTIKILRKILDISYYIEFPKCIHVMIVIIIHLD